jgi:hypothetical protein
MSVFVSMLHERNKIEKIVPFQKQISLHFKLQYGDKTKTENILNLILNFFFLYKNQLKLEIKLFKLEKC